VIVAFDVATGQVTAGVGETRTEQDYANLLDILFSGYGVTRARPNRLGVPPALPGWQ